MNTIRPAMFWKTRGIDADLICPGLPPFLILITLFPPFSLSVLPNRGCQSSTSSGQMGLLYSIHHIKGGLTKYILFWSDVKPHQNNRWSVSTFVTNSKLICLRQRSITYGLGVRIAYNEEHRKMYVAFLIIYSCRYSLKNIFFI